MEPYRSPAGAPERDPVELTESDVRLPKRRNRGVRIVVLVTLILLCIAALSQLGKPGDTPAIGITAASTVLVAFVLLLVLGRRLVGLSRESSEAVARLNAGDVDAARRMFADLVRRSRRWPNYRAQFIANLGVAHLRAGDLDRGLDYLERARASGHLDNPRTVQNHVMLLNALAIGNALKGSVDRARSFEAEASQGSKGASRGVLVMARALIAARANDFDGVEAICAAGWHEAEGALPAFQMRALRLLRAYARDAATRGASENETRPWIEGARPSRPGEFDYLGVKWPEFRAFLAQHGFASGAPKAETAG